MSGRTPDTHKSAETMRAEFDLLADEYYTQHSANVAITGEGPEYFAEYMIADLAATVREDGLEGQRILDFGSGIGNSMQYFRKYFPNSVLTCSDVSARSLKIARRRFPGAETCLLIENDIPLPSASLDIVSSACVFHHIPHEAHRHWLGELLRVTRPGGIVAIYEHNPLNPLILRAVNTCPLNVNAKLIRGGEMRQRAMVAGWTDARVDYRLFFPSILKSLRPLERHLGWLCLGAQYRMMARCPT